MKRASWSSSSAALLALLASVGVAGDDRRDHRLPAAEGGRPVLGLGAYEDRYVLTAVGSGAGIRSGEMKFEFEEGSSPEFLVGISEFYAYSPDGRIETALFTFYPFTELPGGKGLKAPVLKVGASASYGQVNPGRRTAARQDPRRQGQRPDPDARRRPLAGRIPHPRRGRKHRRSPAGGQAAAGSRTEKPGLGREASEYEGEYELSNAAEDPTAKAGTLGAVIGVAQGLGVKGAVVSGGSMTVGGKAPTAEVTIETGGETRELTLTDLAWVGDKRTAQVHDEGPTALRSVASKATAASRKSAAPLVSGHTVYKVAFQKKGAPERRVRRDVARRASRRAGGARTPSASRRRPARRGCGPRRGGSPGGPRSARAGSRAGRPRPRRARPGPRPARRGRGGRRACR